MAVGRRRGPEPLTSSALWANDDIHGEDEWRCLVPGADVRVVTSGGRVIEAHSSVLAAASPVLEARLFNRPPKRHHNGSVILPIPGVPCDAVLAFLWCLYRGKITTLPLPQDNGTITMVSSKHAVHLLVLSHAMRVAWLKRAAVSCLATALRPDDVADLLQLARLCDAPSLKVRCLNYVRRHREVVEATEGWRFLRRCDPRMEAEVTRFVKEAERREERRRRRREENRAYIELGDAVQCLHHILRQGCGGGGRTDDANLQQQPKDLDAAACCRWGQTCQGLRALIRHYATCQQRSKRKDVDSLVAGGGGRGCRRCRRMMQLLRLHAAISVELDHPMPPPISSVCVPKPGDETGSTIKWRLLARKVVCATLMSTLTLSKRKRESASHGFPEENTKPRKNHGAAAT